MLFVTIVTLNDGKRESLICEDTAKKFISKHKDEIAKIERRKTFYSESSAIRFAAEVGGVVSVSYLPDYMSVETIWYVTCEV